MFDSINVLGGELESCCHSPKTGFYRDGFCNTDYDDRGMHTVCIIATQEFLEYSKSMGNDLSTPVPEFNFAGVRPGNKWCLCAGRWLDAFKDGKAPPVMLESTHEETLAVIPLNYLKEFEVTK
jgi:uncharacterized protein (DUF2237 family)